MSREMRKGLLVAAIHIAIVASLGGKLLLDRATRPRVWVRTAPVDPDAPIRGRYVRLRLEAAADETFASSSSADWVPVSLAVQNETLVARRALEPTSIYARDGRRDEQRIAVLVEPVAYFIPEHVADPSIRAQGEELWVEVTVPSKGPPRPIRLGVKKGGVLTPLDVR